MLPIVLAAIVGAGALTIVAYLLWPTWSTEKAGAPDRLPVSIGGTLFNVPAAAIRMKIQRHSGPAGAHRSQLQLPFAGAAAAAEASQRR